MGPATSVSSQIGILQFPGSNCDDDCVLAFEKLFQIRPRKVWHTTRDLGSLRGLIIPGGFSFGDYLRAGHLASLSPCMSALKDFASNGGAILGICNGFQILTESGLLPGTLLPNLPKRFMCQEVTLSCTDQGDSVYHKTSRGLALKIPIANAEGRYYVPENDLKTLLDRGQVVYRYSENPNGSRDSIAGVCSKNGKILGLMPHPERATSPLLGSTDGRTILEGFLAIFL